MQNSGINNRWVRGMAGTFDRKLRLNFTQAFIGVKYNLLYSFKLKARDAFGYELQAEQSTRLGIGLKILGGH